MYVFNNPLFCSFEGSENRSVQVGGLHLCLSLEMSIVLKAEDIMIERYDHAPILPLCPRPQDTLLPESSGSSLSNVDVPSRVEA